MLARDAEVYGFEWVSKGTPSRIAEACQKVGLLYRDGREVSWEGCAGSPQRKVPRRSAVIHPESPVGWLVQFRGVATKYLHHYMTWFSYLVTGLLRERAV